MQEIFENNNTFYSVNLLSALDSLPPDLREIIREYYFEQLTFKQIGEQHGFSLDRAYQLHNKAIRELRKNRALIAIYCGEKSRIYGKSTNLDRLQRGGQYGGKAYR